MLWIFYKTGKVIYLVGNWQRDCLLFPSKIIVFLKYGNSQILSNWFPQLSQCLNILEIFLFRYKKDRITSTPKSKRMTQKKEKLVHRNSMISVLYYMYQCKPLNMEKHKWYEKV